MRAPSPRILLAGALAAAGTAVVAVAAETPPTKAPQAPVSRPPASSAAEAVRFFETGVRPVLVARCQGCHGPDRQSGGLRVDSRAALLKGGAGGPAVVPGRPDQGLLLRALSHQHPRLKMPPGAKLPARQVADLTRWIAQGAPWPESLPAPSASARGSHWSFQPVRRPPVPRPKNAAWVRTPVDAFILAALEKQGLAPAPPADRRTLIRRATFDLTGLPPTPEEVEAFLLDRSPDAWEKVVERLLASPAYGEKWGRHWLDVARYADSNGLDENVAHGNAWRYRDWVVRAFNQDRPYNQFVVEQLAGDLLPAPEGDRAARYDRLIATGFLTLGPKVLAEPDKEKMVMDIVDEQIDTTGKAFMGLTLGCARCHDHKFDPISAEDYYALAGIFKSTRTMESLKTIARWWENPIPEPEDLAAQEAHKKRVAEAEAAVQAVLEREKAALAAAGTPLPKDLEAGLKPEVKAELKGLRDRLVQVQKEAPEIPSAMGVTEADPVDVPVHLRGDHLSLGKVVPRRFPLVLANAVSGAEPPSTAPKQSGRLQLARWLTHPDHPLTGRVLVNRAWRWHFGRGLVASTDNFGLLSERPSHPELLDWLASWFTESGTTSKLSLSPTPPLPHSVSPNAQGSMPNAGPPGANWSLKKLHRLILTSSTYRMSSRFDPKAAAVDPENRLLWRANGRRLEAEELRDALLAVSGTLDRTMGGSLLHVKNREFFFDHTSKDGTKYDSKRRSLYLPLVRNNLYDVFQLFDFVDPAVLESNRATTTVAPQALFWLNSDLVTDAAAALAGSVLAEPYLDDVGRIRRLHLRAYGRPPTAEEIARGRAAIVRLERSAADPATEGRRKQAWAWYTHALLAASEFIYLR